MLCRLCEMALSKSRLTWVLLATVVCIVIAIVTGAVLLSRTSGNEDLEWAPLLDTENLLIGLHDERFFIPLTGTLFEEFIIPCEPKHPEVNVTLCRDDDEQLNIGYNAYFGAIRDNQKENAQMRHNGYYICCILPSGICSQECPHTHTLEVLKHADSVAKPVIDEARLKHVKVGENVTIECSLYLPSSPKFELEWIISNESEDIRIAQVEMEPQFGDEHHFVTYRRKLKIFNTKLEDTGNYTCKVTDHARNTNSDTIHLNILTE